MRSHYNILQPNWNKENSALQSCQELLLYYVWFSTFRSLRMAASLAGLGFICAAFSEATNLESISCMTKFRLGIYFLHREVCLQPPHHIHPAPQKSPMEWNTFSNSVSREQHIEAYQSHAGTFLGILARTPGFGATKHQVCKNMQEYSSPGTRIPRHFPSILLISCLQDTTNIMRPRPQCYHQQCS